MDIKSLSRSSPELTSPRKLSANRMPCCWGVLSRCAGRVQPKWFLRIMRQQSMMEWVHGLISLKDDNMGSNDVMMIYYDEVISRPYHQKHPGGLEQYAVDYKEAYTKLAVIGELHSELVK
jgi:hypothetical protein